MKGNGTGGCVDGTSTTIGELDTADIVFSPGDFSGDGKPDVLWRHEATKQLRMTRGNGTGGFLEGGASVPVWGLGDAKVGV